MSYRLKKKKNVHLIISYPCFFIEKKKKIRNTVRKERKIFRDIFKIRSIVYRDSRKKERVSEQCRYTGGIVKLYRKRIVALEYR